MNLLFFIKKELLLIMRDIHALLVLFVMPLVFILIMSFALKNSFSGEIEQKYQVALLTHQNFQEFQSQNFNITYLGKNHQASVHELLYDKDFDFVVDISQDKKNIDLKVKLGISAQYVSMLKAEIMLAIQTDYLKNIAVLMGKEGDYRPTFQEDYIGKNNHIQKMSSVDHSVPAWLIFSMFFIVIPIANTFINEKTFSTFSRLKSMNISWWVVLVGKLVPYLLVNQIQVLAILGLGLYILPLLGLEALNIRGGMAFIFIISLSTSFAAVAFGLLIANIAKSSEEATTFGGISNIILAAIGGIMVPKSVMPMVMQNISAFSPMSWSLDSFLDVIMGMNNIEDIGWNMLKLVVFALVCLLGSYILLNREDCVR